LSESRLGEDDLDRCGVSGSGIPAVWSVRRIEREPRGSEYSEARSGEGEVVRAGGGDAGWIVWSSTDMARLGWAAGRK
jgi:hypothetical protein